MYTKYNEFFVQMTNKMNKPQIKYMISYVNSLMEHMKYDVNLSNRWNVPVNRRKIIIMITCLKKSIIFFHLN